MYTRKSATFVCILNSKYKINKVEIDKHTLSLFLKSRGISVVSNGVKFWKNIMDGKG